MHRLHWRVLPAAVSLILGNKPVRSECFAEFQLGRIEIDCGSAGVLRIDLNIQCGHTRLYRRAPQGTHLIEFSHYIKAVEIHFTAKEETRPGQLES